MEVTVKASHNGKTVYEYIRNELKLSRRILIRLKQTCGGILVNGEHVTVRRILCEGDILTLATADSGDDINENIVPVRLPLDIIYEDNDIIAVNKPFDMVTHPSHNHYEDSLANALMYYYTQKGIPFVFRAVNRLDRDTTGIVLIAKNQPAAFNLSRQLQSGMIRKSYRAVLSGVIRPENGEIKTYIRRKGESIIEREVSDSGADSEFAHTVYRSLGSNGNLTAVDAEPVTGRTHQLRVHFAYMGCPIYADDLYGKGENGRQALHARKLSFTHPSDGKQMELYAPVAEDILKLYNAWLVES